MRQVEHVKGAVVDVQLGQHALRVGICPHWAIGFPGRYHLVVDASLWCEATVSEAYGKRFRTPAHHP